MSEYKLNPSQWNFINAVEPRFQAFFGGYGNGKTFALCAKADYYCRANPGTQILICRNDFADLKTSTIPSMFALRPELKDKYNSQDHIARYANGSEILFRELKDLRGLAGINAGSAFIDQGEELSHMAFLEVNSRVRRKASFNFVAMVGNPGGHDWIWQSFKEKSLGNPDDYLLFEAPTYENEHNLAPGYIDSIKANAPQHYVNRYIYGSWDSFEGLIWPEFAEARHVIAPIEIPKSWHHYRVLDHGRVNPTACLFAAVDNDGALWIMDEYYTPGPVGQHAPALKQMIEKLGYGIRWTALADPSIFADNQEEGGRTCSIADLYLQMGLSWQPANNDVSGGLLRVSEFFKNGRIKIFANCTNLIREIGDYQWKKLKDTVIANKSAPEQPRKVNDHAADCLRYLCSALDYTRRVQHDKRITEPSKAPFMPNYGGTQVRRRNTIMRRGEELWQRA